MKTTLVLLLLGLVAVNSVYGLKCVTCDNCDDDIPEAKDCSGDGGDVPTIAPGFPTKPTDSPTTVTEEPTTLPATTPTKPPVTENEGGNSEDGTKSKRSANKYLRADAEKEEYKCFKYDIKWGTGTITKRGCTKAKECKTIEDKYTKDFITGCSFCEGDGCNPASNIKSWAFSSVILVAVIKMFL